MLISQIIANFAYKSKDKFCVIVKMKKFLLDLLVTHKELLEDDYVVLRLTNPKGPLPAMLPGQFVEVLVENAANVLLRRPISINYYDEKTNELWLLIHVIGKGTRGMANLNVGDTLNCLLPLGNTFSPTISNTLRPLLVGGGVGTAPMLYLGKRLFEQGVEPTFLLGGRSRINLLQLEEFERFGRVFTTTEDGSHGHQGYVTNHPILEEEHFNYIATCGPKPMMVAIARYGHSKQIETYVSLENMMACGLGACLCCVEKTIKGNVCACTEGPIFNINELTWQI